MGAVWVERRVAEGKNTEGWPRGRGQEDGGKVKKDEEKVTRG